MKRLFLFSLAVVLASMNARAQQYSAGVDITIRSGVDSAEQKKRNKDPAYGKDPKPARIFFLARVSEETGGEKLVRPVDATVLAREVTKQLEAQGFHAAQSGQKPNIVVTVKYGRGFLPNPYTDSEGDKQRTNLSNSDPLFIWPSHDHFVGLNHKRLLASMEKLVIQVRAWEYPPPLDPKKKEKLLWVTTMYVDDPDHRDLNTIADKMLAKGAPYFDRHIGREDEVTVNTATPEGRVEVGPVEVVKDPQPK